MVITSTHATQLSCTQCGGELRPDEGQQFITCPFCGTTVFLDKSRVVFHWSLRPTLDETQAASALARWMSGSQTVKDLDKKARLSSSTFQYFPLWYFKSGGEGKKEEIALEPAAATAITELAHLPLPAGDLVRYDTSVDPQAVEPTVPLATALDWLRQARPQAEVRESALVHVPIYIFKYGYKNNTYTAVVEAATGTVLANIFPAKAEAPYLLIGGITALIYLCLALIPVVAGGLGEGSGFVTAGIVLVIGIILAPFLFAAAAWVAAKI
jgi:predicted RNA-binding Zn-ribbon protein involved in translation (DUF1610 family)